MPFTAPFPAPSNASIYNMYLLCNGAVLLHMSDASTFLLEPDSKGGYVNHTIRRVQDAPHTHDANGAGMLNDGRLMLFPGEFGSAATATGGTISGYTSVFDPVNERWISVVPPGVGGHDSVLMRDNGSYIGPGGNVSSGYALPTPANTTTGLPTNLAATLYSEGGWFLTPEGDNYMFASRGTFADNQCWIARHRDGVTTAEGTVGLPIGEPTPWRLTSATRFRVVSDGTPVNYELGASGWMPKINQGILVGGNGFIYGLLTSGGTRITRLTELPHQRDLPARFRAADTVWGSITTAQTGAAAAAAGTISLAAGPLFPAPTNPFAAVTNCYVETASGWVNLNYTGSSRSGDTITLTGVTLPDIPGASTELMQVGAPVAQFRTTYEAKDQGATFLPNGDLIFSAGIGPRGGFNSVSRVFKWNGQTGVKPVLVPVDVRVLNSTQVTELGLKVAMFPLPDGTILMGASSSTGVIYVPTSDEAIPLAGSAANLTAVSATQAVAGDSLVVTGQRLNGLHEGGLFGDDSCCRTNFPIGRLTNTLTGDVFYCHTAQLSYRGISPTTTSSCTVTIPTRVPAGTYTLHTVANGIASANSFTITVRGAPLGIDIAIPWRLT